MTNDDTIFTAGQQQSLDDTKDYLTELVGDDKKFKTPQDLAKSKVASDNFIEQLKGELKELRTDLAARKNLEQLADQLTTLKEQSSSQDTGFTNTGVKADDNQPSTTLTPERISSLIDDRLSQHEKESMQKNNLNTVRSELLKVYGPDYVSHLDKTTSQFGLTRDQVDQLARVSPKVLLKIAVPERKEEMTYTPPTSTVKSTFTPDASTRNQAWYDKLRERDYKQYEKLIPQMHNDAIRQGESFFNT